MTTHPDKVLNGVLLPTVPEFAVLEPLTLTVCEWLPA